MTDTAEQIDLHDALAWNATAHRTFDLLTQAVTEHQRASGKAPAFVFDAWTEAAKALAKTVGDVLASGPVPGTVVLTGDGPMTVVTASGGLYGALLTEDGDGVKNGWHQPADGPTDAVVRYEVWDRDGVTWNRTGHGFRDARTRKIVQVG